MQNLVLSILLLILGGSFPAGTAEGQTHPLPFKLGGRWGYLGTDLDTLVQPRFSWASPFAGELGRVNRGCQLQPGGGCKGGQWGYVNQDGQLVTELRYTGARPLRNGRARVRKGERIGYVNADGEEVIPPQYANGGDFRNGHAFVQETSPRQETGEWHFIDKKGKRVFSLDEFQPVLGSRAHGMFILQRKAFGQVFQGLMNTNGEELIRPTHDSIRILSKKLIAVRGPAADSPDPAERKWGLIAPDGQVVAKAIYDSLGPLRSGLFRADRDGLSAFLDEQGRMQILPTFRCRDFHNGRAAFTNGEDWGYLNTEGVIVQPAVFEEVGRWGPGVGAAKHGGQWGLIDAAGDFVLPPSQDKLRLFREDYFIAYRSPLRNPDTSGHALLSAAGEVLIPHGPDRIEWVSGSFRAVKASQGWGYINTLGDFVIDPIFSMAGDFHERRAAVQRDGRYGVINRRGEFLTPFAYDSLSAFANGRAAMRTVDGLWGYLNRSGKQVIPSRFEAARRFGEGLAPVKLNDRWGAVNREGELVIRAVFENLKPFSNGLAPAKLRGLWGYINPDGRFVISPRYTEAAVFHEQRARVSTYGDFSGYINADGEKVIHEVFHPNGWSHFSEGFVRVSKDLDNWLFINHFGIRQTDWGRFRAAGSFANGLAPVLISERAYSYLTTDGQLAFDPFYLNDEALIRNPQPFLDQAGFHNGRARMRKGDAYGYRDETGEIAISPRFRAAAPFHESLAAARATARQNRLAYYTAQGMLLVAYTR